MFDECGPNVGPMSADIGPTLAKFGPTALHNETQVLARTAAEGRPDSLGVHGEAPAGAGDDAPAVDALRSHERRLLELLRGLGPLREATAPQAAPRVVLPAAVNTKDTRSPVKTLHKFVRPAPRRRSARHTSAWRNKLRRRSTAESQGRGNVADLHRLALPLAAFDQLLRPMRGNCSEDTPTRI